MERRWRESRSFRWQWGLRWVGWTALTAAFGIGLAGSAHGAGAVTRPAETADAVLVSENQSWNRYLHDGLGLPSWLDLAIDHRTRFEFLEGPFRPDEPDTQSQFLQRTRLRLGADGPGPLRFLAELQDSRVHGDGPRDFTLTEIDTLDVLQLLVTAKTLDLLGTGLRADVHVGRLTMDFGSRRLVAGLELIFTSEQGTPYQLSNVRRAFKAALRAAGLSEVVRLYDLRHTAASLLLEAGLPIPAVSERLGHVNAGVTLGVYSHALEGQQRVAAEAMSAILRGA